MGHMNQNKSPIEVMMDTALEEAVDVLNSGLTIHRQKKVLGYRADFLLENEVGAMLVVECDGHDFHERTPAQAQHDRSRDRKMQASGHFVMRFTGSEIYRDPLACALEAGEFIMGRYPLNG